MWKEIKGYENYQISIDGLIKNKKTNKVLKARGNNNQYPHVLLYGNSKRDVQIGRLVAETFISNPNSLPEVNHEDGNKWNNHISNLKWVTKSENCKHRDSTGLRIRAVVKHSEASKMKMKISRLKNKHLYKRNKLGQYENTMCN
jgi:hypothetical protein